MQEILLDTYTIALPIILGYIVWLLKQTKREMQIQGYGYLPRYGRWTDHRELL